MGMELEWRLQIMTEVGNAIMENGGLEREGGGIGELEKLLEGANGNRQKRSGGPFEKDSWSFFLELGSG
jgi:hypothetical protein